MGTLKNESPEIFIKCRLDLKGSWREVPDQFFDMLGYTRQKIKGMTFFETLHPEDRETGSVFLNKILNGEVNEADTQVRFLTKKRDSVRSAVSCFLIRNRKGNPEYIICTIQNLSKQKELERKLDKREQQFESLFKNNPHPVYYFDLEGNFEGVNHKLVEFTGLSREELLNKGFDEFIVQEDLERTIEQFKKAASGQSGQYEIKVIVRDGEKRDIRVTKFPKYSGDEIVGVYGILQDITDEKAAQRALEKSEQRFKSLFERNPDAVYSFDLDGNFLQANKALEKLTGYDIKELKKLDFEPLVAPDDRERVWEKFNKAARGEPQTYEASGVHKEGHIFYVQVTNLPIYVDGEIVGVFGIAHDITEKKKAQRKLKESEERWEQLIKQNPQPVQIVQDGKIVFINQEGAEYYGTENPKELIGKPILDFTHPDYRDNILKRKKSLEENESIEPDEHKIILLNGEERHIEAHSIPITYKDKPAIQTVIHDITGLKEKQKVIGKSLKEKETLLKEIHHRVKNNLAMISSMLELQIMQSTNESAINTLRDSQLRIRSMGMIHEKLYQNESLHNIGFDEYLEELIQTIRKTYAAKEKNIETSFDLDQVSLDINQVIPCSLIVNEVVVNSFKHAFTDKTEGHLHVSLDFENVTIDLTITDDGKGLPENFNIDEQESLGMTLIQALSSQLDGTIDFSNASNGNGTIFKLRFNKTTD